MPVILNACDFKLRGRNENGNISVDMQDETEKKPLLSTAVARFLQHRLLELVGLCLFVIGCLIMVALASAHSGDPSWSTASNAIIRNWASTTVMLTTTETVSPTFPYRIVAFMA